MTSCEVELCGRPRRSNGLCTMHHSRYRRHGDPRIVRNTPMGEPAAWLADQVYTRDRSDCWLWPFAQSDGYGHFMRQGRSIRATHEALRLDGRPRPADSSIGNALHSCDNPPCVNPDHLRWGTLLDNSADQRARDRLPRGERGGRTVLTERQVIEIRHLYRADRWAPGQRGNAVQLARHYGITRSAVRSIAIGTSWGWLPQPADCPWLNDDRDGHAVRCGCTHQPAAKGRKK